MFLFLKILFSKIMSFPILIKTFSFLVLFSQKLGIYFLSLFTCCFICNRKLLSKTYKLFSMFSQFLNQKMKLLKSVMQYDLPKEVFEVN